MCFFGLGGAFNGFSWLSCWNAVGHRQHELAMQKLEESNGGAEPVRFQKAFCQCSVLRFLECQQGQGVLFWIRRPWPPDWRLKGLKNGILGVFWETGAADDCDALGERSQPHHPGAAKVRFALSCSPVTAGFLSLLFFFSAIFLPRFYHFQSSSKSLICFTLSPSYRPHRLETKMHCELTAEGKSGSVTQSTVIGLIGDLKVLTFIFLLRCL